MVFRHGWVSPLQNGDMVPVTSDAKRLVGLGWADSVRSVLIDLSLDLRDASAEKGKELVPTFDGGAQIIDADIAFRSSGRELFQFLECRVIGRGLWEKARIFSTNGKAPCEGRRR